ncbi:TonB-dependent receptor [Olivibacter sp. SDN3]|uniref:TonB-dependent receptor n=1 Tax=Olivibacter sp. SDN3 TaxID=2764720 RepID=UPI00165108C7|nr:TonB-dependent receptor [Olivibacter sp. SDN3]QNL50910.1 TonB-dependent receptor [Olivibacter sp. SDN3]
MIIRKAFQTKQLYAILLTACLTITFIEPALTQTGKSVSGIVQDSTGLSVIAASVKLTSPSDTLQISTDVDGRFSFKNVKADSFNLTITSLGFRPVAQAFSFRKGENQLNLSPLVMDTEARLLDVVTVTGGTLITIKEDTVEYNAKDYRVRQNAMTEELIKKLDGVEVDKDGNVQAQGESVARVRINGKDYFGGDVKTATKNLPADIIEKIQVIDDYGDQANLTGNRTGDPEKILNITIAEENNHGTFGQFGAGLGNKPENMDDKHRYQVGGMFNSFTNSSQLSILGNLNNNNNEAFNFDTRGSGARRGPRRQGGPSFGNNTDGLTDSYSFGINYRKDFNDKLSTYGNYSYNHSDNTTLSTNEIEEIYPGQDALFTRDNSNTHNITNRHRFDWNLEYKPNDRSFFKLSPTFSLNNGHSNLDRQSLQTILASSDTIAVLQNINDDRNFDASYGISGLYNYKLNDKGRNIFMSFSLNSSKTEQDQDRISTSLSANAQNPDSVNFYLRQLVDIDNKGWNGGASVSYIEPLSERANLELAYDYNFADYDNNRMVDSVDRSGVVAPYTDLNNQFKYTFSTHRVGLTYRFRSEKINYSVGAAVMPTSLNGENVLGGMQVTSNRTGFYFIPVARFEYKASRTKSFTADYSGNASEPSFSQIQPVLDISNPQFLVRGNPDLNAQFNHSLRMRYRNFDFTSGNTFFAMLMANVIQDQIVSNRSTSYSEELGAIVQETNYINANGYYDVRGFYSYSKPFNNRSYVVSLRGGGNYTNNVSFTNSMENIAKNWVLQQSLDVQINPKDWLELRPGISYIFNTTSNTIQDSRNTNITTWAATWNSIITFAPGWVWGLDIAKTSNNGFGSSVEANPLIMNGYVEKQFFKAKNGMLRFSAFDVFNQQVNVNRSVTENRISDSRTNRLARYFMLSFTYRFQNFAGKSGGSFDDGERGRWEGGGRPGGRPGGF